MHSIIIATSNASCQDKPAQNSVWAITMDHSAKGISNKSKENKLNKGWITPAPDSRHSSPTHVSIAITVAITSINCHNYYCYCLYSFLHLPLPFPFRFPLHFSCQEIDADLGSDRADTLPFSLALNELHALILCGIGGVAKAISFTASYKTWARERETRVTVSTVGCVFDISLSKLTIYHKYTTIYLHTKTHISVVFM